MSERHDSARVPQELCAHILEYLPRSQMLAASTVSRIWRRAGLLDARFYLCVSNAINDPRLPPGSPSTTLKHAIWHHMRLSVSFKLSHWRLSKPARLLDSYSWQQFGAIIATASHLVIRVTATPLASDIGTGILELRYPTLRELDLDLPRAYGTHGTPANVHILARPAPRLKRVNLKDILPIRNHDSLTSVTHLHLGSSHCSIATPEDPLQIRSIFPSLQHLSIAPWRHYRSPSCEGVIGPAIRWDGLDTKLATLSLEDSDRTWREFARMTVLSHVPHMRLFVYDEHTVIGAELEVLTSVLLPRSAAQEASKVEPLALLHLSHQRNQVTVAQRYASGPMKQLLASRVLITDTDLWYYCDIEPFDRLLKPFLSHLVLLAVDWDPIVWWNTPNLPALRHLTLYISWDVNEHYEEDDWGECEPEEAVVTLDEETLGELQYPLLESVHVIGIGEQRTLYRRAVIHLLKRICPWNRDRRLVLRMFGVLVDGIVLQNETWLGLGTVEMLPEAFLDDDHFKSWTDASDDWYLQMI